MLHLKKFLLVFCISKKFVHTLGDEKNFLLTKKAHPPPPKIKWLAPNYYRKICAVDSRIIARGYSVIAPFLNGNKLKVK